MSELLVVGVMLYLIAGVVFTASEVSFFTWMKKSSVPVRLRARFVLLYVFAWPWAMVWRPRQLWMMRMQQHDRVQERARAALRDPKPPPATSSHRGPYLH